MSLFEFKRKSPDGSRGPLLVLYKFCIGSQPRLEFLEEFSGRQSFSGVNSPIRQMLLHAQAGLLPVQIQWITSFQDNISP